MITEYERLYAALEGACRRQQACVEAGQDFAGNLTEAFAEYLRCPRRAIAIQPEGVDPREVGMKPFAPEDAITLRKDGWLGFRITLQLGPVRHLSFPLSFKRSGDHTWTVKLSRVADQFEIAESLDNADEAFAAWVDLAASGFETMLDGIVPRAQSSGVEVGFTGTLDATRHRRLDPRAAHEEAAANA